MSDAGERHLLTSGIWHLTSTLMISRAIEQVERLALRMEAEKANRLLGALPSSVIEAMQRARFRRVLRLAARSSAFYREQFRKRGIAVDKIRHPSELGDFFTTGEDLRAHGAEHFLTGHADTAFETTGTTSPVPKRAYFSQKEINEIGRSSALGLHFLGLHRTDRVMSAFDCSFWVSPVVVRSAFQYINCFHVEAGKIEPLEFYERALAYLPNVIFGEPSWIVRLSEIADGRGTWPVKFLFAGGENITEAARAAVERVWQAPLYLNYGQTEAFGAIGVECKQKDGYHRNDLNFIFEVVEDDEEGNGELVYTTLTRNVMPLIRYRSTDITRVIDEPCACGLFAKRIGKIRARSDEMVVCGMGNVGPWVFAEVLGEMLPAGADWQAVIKSEGYRDLIEIHLELPDRGQQQQECESKIRQNLRERFPDFWRNYEMRLYDLKVIRHPQGSLRTGRKLRRVIDERQMLLRSVI
jgi:phenylacetate-CoA ligase